MNACAIDTEVANLAELRKGETAVILRFASDDSAFLRFREMGLLPGTEVTFVRRAPLGDPMKFEVRGALLSIRKADAAQIEVERR